MRDRAIFFRLQDERGRKAIAAPAGGNRQWDSRATSHRQ